MKYILILAFALAPELAFLPGPQVVMANQLQTYDMRFTIDGKPCGEEVKASSLNDAKDLIRSKYPKASNIHGQVKK